MKHQKGEEIAKLLDTYRHDLIQVLGRLQVAIDKHRPSHNPSGTLPQTDDRLEFDQELD